MSVSPLLPGEAVRPDDSPPVAHYVSSLSTNTPPVAADDAYAMNGRQQLGANVSANDNDADGDAVSVALVSGPSHGTLGFGTDGRFTYTPDRGFDGVDTFSYVASDGQAASNVATVNIAVTRVGPINDPPSADADEYRVDEGETLSVAGPGVLSNDSDANGDGLSAVLNSAPGNGLLLLGTDGSFDYTPNAGFHGTDSFTYAANDGQIDSNPATVTITVDAVNHAPTAADDSYSTLEDQPLSVPAGGVLGNDTDADGDALTAVLAEGPANGILALNPDGSFQYTPNAGFHGTDSFTYAANDGQVDAADDGQVGSNPATVTITVDAVEEPPAPELAVHLEVSSSPFGPEAGPIWSGSTFWVSAYVEDLRAVPQGVVGGALDLEFDAARLTPTGNVAYGTQFTEYQQGTADSQAGVIEEAGALATEGGVGVDGAAPFVAWEFRRGGPGAPDDPNSQVVFAANPGEGTATILPANFAMVGAGTPVDWSNVTFDKAQLNLYLGDFNSDGAVNHYDLALWIPHADSSPESGEFDPKFDLSGDSRVDAVDLAILMPRLFRPVLDDLEPPAQDGSGQSGVDAPDNGPPATAETPRDRFGHHHRRWRDATSSVARMRRIGSLPCRSELGDDLNWVSSIVRVREHNGRAHRQTVAIDWAFHGDDLWMGG